MVAAILFSGHPYIGRHYRATLIGRHYRATLIIMVTCQVLPLAILIIIVEELLYWHESKEQFSNHVHGYQRITPIEY